MALRKILCVLFILSYCSCLTNPAQAQAKPLLIETQRQLYQKAYCAYQRQDYKQSARIFNSFVDSYPQMGDYISHYLAKSQFALGNYSGAIASWRRLIKNYPHSILKRAAKLGRADANLYSENYRTAAKLYKQLLSEKNKNKADTGHIYFNYGRAMEFINQPAKAGALYQHLWERFPTAGTISLAKERMSLLNKKYNWKLPLKTQKSLWQRIKALQNEKEHQKSLGEIEQFLKKFPKSPLSAKVYLAQGENYLKLGKRLKAKTSFRIVATKYANSPQVTTALFRAAKNYWNMGNNKRAILNLNVLLKKYPDSNWNDDALYVLGRIHEGNKAYPRALKTYQRLIRSYPRSIWADKGIWRMGWIHYKFQKYSLAIKTFSKAIKKPARSPWREACLYWMGRSQERLGQIKRAVNSFQTVIKTASYTYYAQLARQRLPHLTKKPLTAQITVPKSIPYKFPVLKTNSVALRFHLNRTKELLALNMLEDLNHELDVLAKTSNRELDLWVYLSKTYQLAENYTQAIRVLWNYLALKNWGTQQLSPETLTLFYPRFFWKDLEKLGKEYRINPFLLAAIIRRESVFDPRAESRAGALGLMQIIPSTANRIANQLKDKNFQTDQLLNPKTNLRYGSFYFSKLLKQFKGKHYLAMAAYNAGEKHTERWQEKIKAKEWMEFVEDIPFTETRHYIRQVISNYNNYLLLYQETPYVNQSNH